MSESDQIMSCFSKPDPSAGLTLSLVRAAADRGQVPNPDDVHAVLGLPWLYCASPTESSISHWQTMARDLCLVPAARVFGLQLRDIHPPEAARGLESATEFEQHFDASYRPLIARALEHHQPVIAWRGWENESGSSWGIVTHIVDDGVGFAGVTPRQRGEVVEFAPALLVRPTWQVYVVEAMEPANPTSRSLVATALLHARQALDPAIGERLGLLTGVQAFDRWMQVASESSLSQPATRNELRELLHSVMWNIRVGVQFLNKHVRGVDGRDARDISAIGETMDRWRSSVAPLCDSVDRRESWNVARVQLLRLADQIRNYAV